MAQVIRIPGAGEVIGGQYELGEEIGRGGFGVVFRARQLGVVERDVAIKMLLPHAMTTQGVVERFAREARLAASLSHPNSVVIYNHGLHQPSPEITAMPYIAMEYLDGETLQQYLARHKRLTVEDASEILMQALGSLGEAHSKGIVHRDIKPENIFLCNRGRAERVVKVLDFGIAKAVDGDWDPVVRERLTRTGLVAGNAEYMATEQASGKKDLTAALDVYAMGCIAFQCLAGRVPYDGTSPMDIAIKHISNAVPPLPSPYKEAFIGRVVRRAMSKDPRERFTDANHFARVLQAGEMEAQALLFDGDPETFDEEGPPTVDADYVDGDVFATQEVDQIHSADKTRLIDRSGGATVLVAAMQDEHAAPMEVTVRDDVTDSMEFGDYSPPKRSNATAFVVAGMLFLLVLIVGVGLAAYAILVDSGANMPVASIRPPKARTTPPLVDKGDKASPEAPAAAVVVPIATPDAGTVPAPVAAGAGDTSPPTPAADAGVVAAAYTMVEVQTNTNAKVYLNGKSVGNTPFKLTQRQFGEKPVQIELRSRGYQRKTVSIDWREGIITANLRKTGRLGRDKSPPGSDGGAGARKGQTGKAGGSDGKTRKPAVFDPGAGPNKTKKPRETPKLFN
jgi:serine/threonine protein kinase